MCDTEARWSLLITASSFQIYVQITTVNLWMNLVFVPYIYCSVCGLWEMLILFGECRLWLKFIRTGLQENRCVKYTRGRGVLVTSLSDLRTNWTGEQALEPEPFRNCISVFISESLLARYDLLIQKYSYVILHALVVVGCFSCFLNLFCFDCPAVTIYNMRGLITLDALSHSLLTHIPLHPLHISYIHTYRRPYASFPSE